jgi:hypothetical protein
MIDKDVRYILKKQDVQYTRYFTTPTALQNWLWYVWQEMIRVIISDTVLYLIVKEDQL